MKKALSNHDVVCSVEAIEHVLHMPEERFAVVVLQAISAMKGWELSVDQCATALGATPGQIDRWERDANERPRRFTGYRSGNLIARVSLILGIHRSLQQTFVEYRAAVRWLQSRNSAEAFSGLSPLDVALSGMGGMRLVRGYLDAH